MSPLDDPCTVQDGSPKRQRIEPQPPKVWHGHKIVRTTNFYDIAELHARVKK